MLACLPAPGDVNLRLLPRTQMNTGPQKWGTTQILRSACCPSPAQLDAFAKRVAHSPLTIQIFPNSVRVPQRKHVRRTVNGLDTSSPAQRHTPSPSQVGAGGGLLAVLRAPKESDGRSRARHAHKATMNPHGGSYTTQSTLNLPHLQGQSQPAAPKQVPVPPQQGRPQAAPHRSLAHAQALQRQHSLPHPQALQGQHRGAPPQTLQGQQALPHPQSLQGQHRGAPPQTLQGQQGLPHPQDLQGQHRGAPPQTLQGQQGLPHPQGLQGQHRGAPPQTLQGQQGLPHPQTLQGQHRVAPPPTLQGQQGLPHPQALQGAPVPPQQRPAPLQTLKQQVAPPPASQDLRHVSDGAQHPGLQQAGPQGLPQAVAAGPPALSGPPQQPPVGPYGARKLPDADAPPNVTVSTSTIPLSMAAGLHQNRAGDLSSIVHQINQLCQARAGMGATSVCEGQIANPSPISRNLLISASSRVSSQHPSVGGVPACLVVGPPDKAAAQTPGAALHSQPCTAAPSGVPPFHTDPEKVQLQQHLQLQRSWAQHQMAHMQQPPEGAHPCKNPRLDPAAECAFPARGLGYPHKMPAAAQGFLPKHPAEKPRPPSPGSCQVGAMPYMNGHYMAPPWSGVPSGPGSQDRAPAFQRGQAAASSDRIPGAKYRPGGRGAPGGHAKLVQNMEYLGEEFHLPGFQDQNLDVMEKMHRSTVGRAQEPGANNNNGGGGVHAHHHGYC